MAGFLDRAKEAAQKGVEAGRHKVDEVQTQRAGRDLLYRLGVAYYNQQRRNASGEPVDDAMRRIDEHVAAHGDATLPRS